MRGQDPQKYDIISNMRAHENIFISSLTTMRLGGVARHVIEIEKPQDVVDAYGFAAHFGLPTFVLGAGSNTLGHDEGWPGVILINRMRGIFEEKTEAGPVQIKIMGGEPWDNVVEYACKKGLTGIEALSKIPGLAGAAPVQNIGAYGQEISNVLTEVNVYDSATATFKILKKDELNFSYRKSIFNTTDKKRFFIISITLELREGSMRRPFYNSIENYISEHKFTDFSPKGVREIISAIRAEKLPDPKTVASAGSFFKNVYIDDPEAERATEKGWPVHRSPYQNKINAAWLIEQAGFKGKLLHGIRVSEKAPLVLINESAKSYNDLAKARSEIIGAVYDKFGYWLEQEPVELV